MSAPLGLSSIFYSVMSVAAPPSCAVVVPSQTVIPPSMCGANGAASSDALSVIGVFVPISVLLWFTLSARVHPPPPLLPGLMKLPLSRRLWYGLSV